MYVCTEYTVTLGTVPGLAAKTNYIIKYLTDFALQELRDILTHTYLHTYCIQAKYNINNIQNTAHWNSMRYYFKIPSHTYIKINGTCSKNTAILMCHRTCFILDLAHFKRAVRKVNS